MAAESRTEVFRVNVAPSCLLPTNSASSLERILISCRDSFFAEYSRWSWFETVSMIISRSQGQRFPRCFRLVANRSVRWAVTLPTTACSVVWNMCSISNLKLSVGSGGLILSLRDSKSRFNALGSSFQFAICLWIWIFLWMVFTIRPKSLLVDLFSVSL